MIITVKTLYYLFICWNCSYVSRLIQIKKKSIFKDHHCWRKSCTMLSWCWKLYRKRSNLKQIRRMIDSNILCIHLVLCWDLFETGLLRCLDILEATFGTLNWSLHKYLLFSVNSMLLTHYLFYRYSLFILWSV
jgi:hypothetical protein